jgi:glycosyltransferase involved in cell wall biosynthesis
MRPARVSVAMATCEGGRFVDEQLASIASQRRPPDELVVCDDASKDDTFERVQAFASRAAFEVRASRNRARLGTTANFEQAIRSATGELVFLADQDDVWHPEKIEILAGVLAAHPATGAVFCDGDVIREDGRPLGYTLWRSLGFDGAEQRDVREGRAFDVFLRHVVAAGTTLAFRARLRDRALPFPALRSCHDAFVAFVAAATCEVEIVSRPLVQYRFHGANQIGIRRLGFFEQLAKAREQLEGDAFGYAAEFFRTARTRLSDLPPERLARIDAKILHATRRASMSPRLLERLPQIREELGSGRYRRFSYGWKSVAQDLLLR